MRKAIRYSDDNQESWSLVSNAELQSSLRFVNESETGTVEGNCNDMMSNSDKVVVYAYTKGSYNQDAEIQGEAHAQFSNAVTSTSVDANGDFQLSFLEDEEYELVFAAYEEDTTSGRMELEGFLQVSTLLGLDLGLLGVEANSSVSVNVLVTGMIQI